MRRLSPCLVLILALGAPPPAPAQVPAAATEMLRRLYASRDFASERFGPARWIENGAAYTTVEPSDAVRGGGASDIVRYETATGARSVSVSARRLIPAGDSLPLDIDDYGWSADGSQLLLFTNSRRVWRQNTRGDYWVLDRRTWKLQKLGGGGTRPHRRSCTRSSHPRATGWPTSPGATCTSRGSRTARSPGSPPEPTRCT